MKHPDWAATLEQTCREALRYLDETPDGPVGAAADIPALRTALGGDLPEQPQDSGAVLADLARAAAPGLVRTSSGRFFGFVIGGSTPAALGADWLTSTWDQNAALARVAPAASVVEEVAGAWLKDLLRLPATASAGFVTGGQAANLTALAAARNEVLRRAGWDVGAHGLHRAPAVRVLVGEMRHDTIDRAVRLLGLGDAAIVPVDADDQGRMSAPALARSLGAGGPTIVCAQAGEINTGAFDPFGEICDLAHAAGAWVHVDGAFGLWAAASPRTRHLLAGADRADSWATDAHKWLNVPYDAGLVFCADGDAHRAAVRMRADYLAHGHAGERDPMDFVPELSRRARGFPVYAALRALGRRGVADMIAGSCALAGRFADGLRAADGVRVLNDVVLNQVLVRFGTGADAHRRTLETVRRVQDEGTCWVSDTVWNGQAAMRISVTNWSTDEQDVDRSVEAILRCSEV